MAAIQKQEQNAANRWYTWIKIDAGESLMLITPHKVNEADALEIQARYIDERQYDGTPHAGIDLYENREMLRKTVTYIKNQNPSAAQFTAMLANNATWYEVYRVRYFLAALALKLAERAEVQIDDFSEAQVFAKMKAFIIATPLRRLNKIMFGER